MTVPNILENEENCLMDLKFSTALSLLFKTGLTITNLKHSGYIPCLKELLVIYTIEPTITV